jgi:hypothetical protein
VSGSVTLMGEWEGDDEGDDEGEKDNPLATAIVQLSSLSGDISGQSDIDANGRFVLALPPGQYIARVLGDFSQTIRLAPADYTFARKPISQEAMTVEVEQDVDDLELRVAILVPVQGIVRDGAGNRVANARVLIDPAPIDAGIDTMTNSKGEFVAEVPWTARLRAGRRDLGWSASTTISPKPAPAIWQPMLQVRGRL